MLYESAALGRAKARVVPRNECAMGTVRGDLRTGLIARSGADSQSMGGPGRVDCPSAQQVLRIDVHISPSKWELIPEDEGSSRPIGDCYRPVPVSTAIGDV